MNDLLQQKDIQLQQKDGQIQQMNNQLQQKDTQLQQKDVQLQQQGAKLQERTLQLNRQLREVQTLRVRKWMFYILYRKVLTPPIHPTSAERWSNSTDE